jgi:cytochrome b subunit of formate dehydrogenase
MKSTYRVLALLISVGVLVQAMAIALGWFTVMKDVDGGAVYDKNTEYNFGQALHSLVGMMVIPLLAILLLIVSFFAGVAGGVKWAAIVFGLVVLQIALAFAAFGAPVVGALHGANALALMAVAGIAGSRVAKQTAAPTAVDTEATA